MTRSNWYNDTADVINALGLDSLGQAWTGDGTGGVLGSGGWIKASHYLNGMGGLSNVRVRILLQLMVVLLLKVSRLTMLEFSIAFLF